MTVIAEGPIKIDRSIVLQAWRRRSPNTRIVIRDSACHGLALVVNARSMTWRYDYKPRGADPKTGKRWSSRSSYFVVGETKEPQAKAASKAAKPIAGPQIAGPEEARRWASEQRGIVAGGGDPAMVKRDKVRRAIHERANTLGRLVDEYAMMLPNRPKLRGAGPPSAIHVEGELHALRAAITEMDAADRPPAQLDPSMIRTMLRKLGKHPAAARARFGALSRFCDWLLDEGRISINPCQLISRASRPKPPPARSGFLSPEQLGQLWRSAEALDPVRRDFLRFLIAIPCRRGEATRLDWQHLDLARAIWSQPEKLTKNGDPHRLHLHPLALDMLRARHRSAGCPSAGLVFPAPRSGRTMTTWRNAKDDLVKASGIVGWQLHDLRRSFASALGEKRAPEPVIDAILNHRQTATRSGVLGVYQRSVRWPEQMEIMQQWGELLAAVTEDGATNCDAKFTVQPIRANQRRVA